MIKVGELNEHGAAQNTPDGGYFSDVEPAGWYLGMCWLSWGPGKTQGKQDQAAGEGQTSRQLVWPGLTSAQTAGTNVLTVTGDYPAYV